MVNIFLTGTAGQMERVISSLIKESPDCTLAEEISSADVIIDFSAPNRTLEILPEAISSHKPMVIGTTGFTSEQEQIVLDAAKKIPIVFDYNMSIGINVMRYLVSEATAMMSDWDIEIMEAHHRHKKDSPSGTALVLAREIAAVRNQSGNGKLEFRNQGMLEKRESDRVGMQVIRAGNIVGEHTVYYCGQSERIELTHRAMNREIFAKGAIKAALFLNKVTDHKIENVYRMQDVILNKMNSEK